MQLLNRVHYSIITNFVNKIFVGAKKYILYLDATFFIENFFKFLKTNNFYFELDQQSPSEKQTPYTSLAREKKKLHDSLTERSKLTSNLVSYSKKLNFLGIKVLFS